MNKKVKESYKKQDFELKILLFLLENFYNQVVFV